MKNSLESFKEIRKVKFNESLDKRLAQDLARADDDGLATAKIISGAPSMDQDLDCWSDLWQRIKAKALDYRDRRNIERRPFK